MPSNRFSLAKAPWASSVWALYPEVRRLLVGVVSLVLVTCTAPATQPGPGGAVHLDEIAGDARIESGSAPMQARRKLQWGFADHQPAWRTLSTRDLGRLATVETEQLDDALQLAFSQPSAPGGMLLIGGLQTELDDLRLEDWEAVLVRARSSDRFAGITVAYNLSEARATPGDLHFFFSTDEAPPVFNDGSEQIYSIPLRAREGDPVDTPLRSVGVLFGTVSPARVDIQSIELVPKGASFLEDTGVRHVTRAGETRSTLFAHTPASFEYSLDLPQAARLDLGLTTEPSSSVTYRVLVGDEEDRTVVLETTVGPETDWSQHTVDLSSRAGTSTKVILEATSEREGAVAMWGAPSVAGAGSRDRPNVIFYVIDGAGADLMSLYDYNRQTTPFLEELAQEGAVFDHAYANSTWTQPSTVSFMTSLQHSVLGGLRRGVHSTAVPAEATTMAEHFRQAGYLTASFTSNPNAGRIIGLERGVDVLRDAVSDHHSVSSRELHEEFWTYRKAYPGGPYWVHFQTTDVHEPNRPEPPFAGLYVSPEQREQLGAWDQQIFQVAGPLFGRSSISSFYDVALDRAQIDRQAYFGTRRGLYDETMAHQDHTLAQLVKRLKAEGEWENTLLVIGADHGHPAGSFARWGRGLFDPQPEPWEGALFDAYATRVPMLFIWPGKIAGGQRFSQAVSMIDVLPTVLDLVGLPQPEAFQGQSVAPLLLGEQQDLRPVVLDEFRIDEGTGEMIGNLEIIDGRWGVSMEIGPRPEGGDPQLGRHTVPVGGRWGALHEYFPEAPRTLLYDLWADPFALQAVNKDHPELVEHYEQMLLEQWEAHQALASQFGEGQDVALTPEQLEQLRSLGYIQ